MTAWHASRFTGLFREFGPVARRASDPDVPIWAGTPANRPPGQRVDAVGGAGWIDEEAELAALGEAIERWQMHALPLDRTIRASFARWPHGATGEVVDPARWALYHADQYATAGFPFARLDAATELDWLAFRRIADGEPCWAPLELAVTDLRDGAAHRFQPAISTGWSAHRTVPLAVLRALQEVIERDAATCAWCGTYALEEWPPRSCSGVSCRSSPSACAGQTCGTASTGSRRHTRRTSR